MIISSLIIKQFFTRIHLLEMDAVFHHLLPRYQDMVNTGGCLIGISLVSIGGNGVGIEDNHICISAKLNSTFALK